MRGLCVGFNHNVHFRGRVFHVQSEDLGARYAYAITHVFDDAGRVVKTRKLSYAEFQADSQVMNQIHQLLRAQHTRVVEEVAQGFFDDDVFPATMRSITETPSSPGSLMPRSCVRPIGKPEASTPCSEPFRAPRRQTSGA
jgi:hypothetical protein